MTSMIPIRLQNVNGWIINTQNEPSDETGATATSVWQGSGTIGMKTSAATNREIRAVLTSGDERLLRDAGLERYALGPERYFWSGWNQRQALWQL